MLVSLSDAVCCSCVLEESEKVLVDSVAFSCRAGKIPVVSKKGLSDLT